MTQNVALPLLGQLQGGALYELTKIGTDDEDKTEKETETEKEKESLTFSCYKLHLGALSLEKFRKSLFAPDDFPISEHYAALPELPPDA